MKKKILPRTIGVIKSIFNFRAWIDWDRIKAFTLYLLLGFKKFFVPQKREVVEDFKEAKARLNLSNEELAAKQKALYRMSLLMIGFALFVAMYGFYHLYLGSLRAFVLSLIVMMIALVLAFRYHFWYFQIKKGKLGCSLLEWYREGLLGEKQ